jgi:hypothetical protein
MAHADSQNPDPQATGLKRLVARLEIDDAVGYAISARFWQLFTGPLTQILIVFCFSGQLQGYYYAFLNVLAIQLFIELGLHGVLINVASHEWSQLKLEDGSISGDSQARGRLLSLSQQSARWYLAASALFCVVAMLSGFWFFSASRSGAPPVPETDAPIPWQIVWIVVVLLTSAQLATLPLTSILEGCNQLGTVNRVRFVASIVGTLLVWTLMITGAGLWALAGSAAVRLGGELYLILFRYRSFFQPIFKPLTEVASINWKQDVAPLQWRMALQGPLNWLANHLGALVVFHFHGSLESGKLGMTLTVMTALQSASGAWIEARRPVFGQLIAAEQFDGLDSSFYRTLQTSVLLLLIALSGFCLGVYIFNTWSHWLFDRLASRLVTTQAGCVLAVGVLCQQISRCLNIYVRAHKREPFLPVAILVNGTIAALAVTWGRSHGIIGIVTAYSAGQACLQLPCSVLVWRHARTHWQARSPTDAQASTSQRSA